MGFNDVLDSCHNLAGRIGMAVRGDNRPSQLIAAARGNFWSPQAGEMPRLRLDARVCPARLDGDELCPLLEPPPPDLGSGTQAGDGLELLSRSQPQA